VLYNSDMNLIQSQSQTPTAAPDTCEGELMFSFLQAAGALEGRLEDALETVGLSLPKLGVLSLLVKAGEPLTLSQLAARSCCVRSNMTQLMDRLEADGLVRRVDDPTDRRIVRATLTPLGEERQAAGARQMELVQDWFEASLAGVDRAALGRALAALT
jgi:DNA-binding MarR family transcriptional regulator